MSRTIQSPKGYTPARPGLTPSWSEYRQDWIPLAELEEGEQLCSLGSSLQTSDFELQTSTVLSSTLGRAKTAVYNIEVHGQHVYQVGELGVLVHNACNLNADSAVFNFGVYEIAINGSLWKIGKAHSGRITQSSGLPTRLHQQVRKLGEIFGAENVVGRVVTNLGETSTEAAKLAEYSHIQKAFQQTGFIPFGNLKSFF